MASPVSESKDSTFVGSLEPLLKEWDSRSDSENLTTFLQIIRKSGASVATFLQDRNENRLRQKEIRKLESRIDKLDRRIARRSAEIQELAVNIEELKRSRAQTKDRSRWPAFDSLIMINEDDRDDTFDLRQELIREHDCLVQDLLSLKGRTVPEEDLENQFFENTRIAGNRKEEAFALAILTRLSPCFLRF